MNTNIKNAVAVIVGLAVLLVGLAAMSYVKAYSSSIQPSSFRSFTVSGEGEVVAVPDVAQFSFEVISEGGKDISKLQKDNTDKMNKAIEYVKKQGVDPKDIKTQNYSLEPRYKYYNCSTPVYYREGVAIAEPSSPRECPPPEIVGYTIRQSVTVKVRDFSKVGDILSGVITNGANTVSQLSFTIDDPEKVRSEAREEAIAKANEKAKAIAKAAGFRLGRLLSIDEGGGYFPPMPYYSKMEAADGRGGAMAVPAPSIEPGSQDVNVTVTLRYEIE